MSMSEETWRDAPGYDGLYMVSDLGNVASLGGRKGSEAVEIFKSDEPASAIARKYGISDTMVRRIKQRKAWREATCQLTA